MAEWAQTTVESAVGASNWRGKCASSFGSRLAADSCPANVVPPSLDHTRRNLNLQRAKYNINL